MFSYKGCGADWNAAAGKIFDLVMDPMFTQYREYFGLMSNGDNRAYHTSLYTHLIAFTFFFEHADISLAVGRVVSVFFLKNFVKEFIIIIIIIIIIVNTARLT